MNRKEILADNTRIPDGFVKIGLVDHPHKGLDRRRRQWLTLQQETSPVTNRYVAGLTSGVLARNRATGVYVLVASGRMISVSQNWAADMAASMGKSADVIQEQCIAQMASLQLTPDQVADRVGDSVSRAHVCDYLSRRSSIGSHKLQHVFAALQLAVTPQLA